MRDQTVALARGSAARATLDYIRETHGDQVLERILNRVEPDARRDLTGAETTGYLPYSLVLALWNAADGVIASADPEWMERAGGYAIGSLGQQLYGGLLRKSSPVEFVTQSVSLFQLYYSQGDVVPVELEPGRAVLRLVGFDTLGPLFCRRQTGGLRRATELAGGTGVAVRHVRCAHEGDAFCEWEIGWSSVR